MNAPTSEDLAKLKIKRDGKPAASGLGRKPWRVKKRYWLLPLAVLALIFRDPLAGQLTALKPAPKVEVINVGAAAPAQSLSLFNATGYVVAQTKADVASKATGRIERLEVEEGSVVKKGDVVARLENQDVSAAMERARANVEAAQSAVKEAEARRTETFARVGEAQAELDESQRVLARAQGLIEKKFITQEVFDAALARRDKARAALRSVAATVTASEAAIISSKAQVGAAQAALSESQVTVEYTLIRAPFDGVILQKHADIGDVVAPFASTAQSKGAVVSMADMSTLQVEADVSESNLTKLLVGQPCLIELDALPEVKLKGTVHMIVPTVDRAKATVLAKVRFNTPDARILPDMSARVAFLSRELAADDEVPRTVVPTDALVERGGQTVAFRLEANVASQVAVKTGGKIGEQIIVLDGLKVGDKIIAKPGAEISDGLKVSLPK